MGARPIKRLRVNKEQAALCADEGGLHQKSPVERYITTLLDKAPETPKSSCHVLAEHPEREGNLADECATFRKTSVAKELAS